MPPQPPHNKAQDQYRIEPPKKLKEVPAYVKEMFVAITGRMSYIIKLVWEANPGIIFVMMFMTVFNGLMPVTGSLIGKEILNALAKSYTHEITSFNIILWLLMLQFGYLLLKSIVDRIYVTLTRISGEVIGNHIKIKLMIKSKEVDLASYDSPEYYSKLENATREASRQPLNALTSTFSIISTVISIVSYIIVILAIGILPALAIIAIATPSTFINFYFRKKNFNYMWRSSTERRQLNYYSQIVVNKDLIKEIKLLGLTDTFTDKYTNVFDVYYKGLKKLIVDECKWNVGASLLSTLVNCVLFVYIARGVFDGNYEIGNYALYTGALNAISAGIAKLITTTASIYECTLFINNLIDYMQAEPTIVPSISPARKVERGVDHRIVFENVSFRYPGTEADVLKNINITIDPRDSIVIVGLNGAGKTTLIKLLMRLYDPTEGRIILDGHDIKEYEIEGLYSLFGTVFQDYGKYAVTVKENIAFGEILKEVIDDEIESAAKHSNSSSYIEALPHKYDTPLMRYFDDKGTELSIGQWQKLAIARSFYSDSDIFILDEPTAALDPMAEQEIFNQFDELRSDKTTIFVSHRLSSATTATKIMVMKYGEIIELGNHAELMELKGEYHTLFSTQANRYTISLDEHRDNRDRREKRRRGKGQFADGMPRDRRDGRDGNSMLGEGNFGGEGNKGSRTVNI
ncbi:ABC transporter ATP-binding protein [Candidatus Epulonipiscium viviparus]|uniref:ABC transporter ATP-binding protein n=1 Tax=Candidatus Epulonipiscium viviparus TaxID=420336 RepID=UPI0027380BA8|nr:ABC transporter ATP-binding protein [Candidatus Epulopiscium viviparus]